VKRIALLLLLVLSACSGTSEPPLDLLLAFASGHQIVFYPPGKADAASVGDWEIGADVVDLARPAGSSLLWVLTPQQLRAYPISGGDLAHAPVLQAPQLSLDLNGDCASGRLRPGENALLVSCGQTGVWTVPYDAPLLQALDTSGDDPGTLYLPGPDDQVARLTPTLSGFRLQFPGGDGLQTFEISSVSNAENLVAAWRQNVLAVAMDDGSQSYLYTWDAGGGEDPKPLGGPLALHGLRWIGYLGGAAEGWLLGSDSGYALRRQHKSDLLRNTPVALATVTPDEYAYLAADAKLTVLDLLDPQLQEHSRTLTLSPRALVYLPVGE